MKQLVCEMCGSTDLVKQDGVFVCQSCGCKYSVEEAKKMMVEGTVQVEGTVKIDNTDQAKTFKDMAINAYNGGNTKEAYHYFLKVLEIDPSDFQSVFYKGMCQGWETTLARSRVGEAINSYYQAMNLVPDEISKSVSELFVNELTNLISAWFDKARERFWDVDEWYSSNVSIFWDYLEVCEQVINYIDGFKQVALDSDSVALKKNVGQVYCDACYGMCTNIVEWTSYSQDNATFPGLSLQRKQPYLKKYDDMIFEVRKYDSEFKKIEVTGTSVWGTIDRAAPPTRIGAHNMAIIRQNNQNCIRVDREIDERVKKWKEEEEKRKKAEKERQYWESHPEDKKKCEVLKAEYDARDKVEKSIQIAKNSAESLVKKYEDTISDLNEKISSGNVQIAKLEKKIFGKAKAQKNIEAIREEISEYQKGISDVTGKLNEAKVQRDNAARRYNEANTALQSAKKEYETFLRNCGL